MLAALGLSGVGLGVLLVWSAVTNVSPVDVARSVFDPSITPAPLQTERPRSSSPSAGPPSAVTGTPPVLVTVLGIQVAASIAASTTSLLTAARRAGLANLHGSGYRSPARQIELRRQNCGTSDYDIYRKPAAQCSPPTAPPGSSMHEQGLAIDFTENGRSLTRSSPAYRWLQANAGKYGFRNLPSEPWHWSVNGR